MTDSAGISTGAGVSAGTGMNKVTTVTVRAGVTGLDDGTGDGSGVVGFGEGASVGFGDGSAVGFRVGII